MGIIGWSSEGEFLASIRILGRLLRLRELEEDQGRLLLKAAAVVREELSGEMTDAIEEAELGRRTFHFGVERSDSIDRAAGLVASGAGERLREHLKPRLRAAELELERQRTEFLNRRTSRLQVETLEAEARLLENADAGRRAQQMLDDWYGRRSNPGESKPTPGALSLRGGAEMEGASTSSIHGEDEVDTSD